MTLNFWRMCAANLLLFASVYMLFPVLSFVMPERLGISFPQAGSMFLVFAAAMGGNLSLIGAPGNMIAQSTLEPLGLKFGFFEYVIVGLPILIGGFLFYATVGFKILPNYDTVDTENSIFDESKDFSQVPKWKKCCSWSF